MKINVDIDDKYDETYVTIHAKQWSEEIDEMIKRLNITIPKRIVAIDGDKSILLAPNEIDFIYAENRKVYASMNKKSFELTFKLYEAERLLEAFGFTRLSKSVIANINKIAHFELSFNGNLCVFFHSGSKEYVSRKYVQELKKKLIMEVDKNGR